MDTTSRDGRRPWTASAPRSARGPALLALLAGAALLAGCGDGATGPDGDASAGLTCSIPRNQIFDGGVGRDGIPALSNPTLMGVGGEGTDYLDERVPADPHARVIGLATPEGPVAVPLRILWWHEIANFELGDREIAATLCPLTGSTLVFDREAVGGREFVVSGLLYLNNLMMAPRDGGRTLFPQMSRGARCGPDRGTELRQVPHVEMSWDAWKELHPDTRVVSSRTGVSRDYTRYPYGNYNNLSNPSTLFPVPRIDDRRQPKERVLGIPDEDGGLAVPFLALENAADVVADSVSVGGEPVWVFWKTPSRGATAFRPRAELASGETRSVSFTVDEGKIVDRGTGSTWTLDGRAVAGPLQGARLEPVREAYVAFWFAWALFQPETEIWESPSSGSDAS